MAALLSINILKQPIFTKSCIPFEHLTLHKTQDVTATSTSERRGMKTKLVMSGNYADSKTPSLVWCHRNN
jgi:hypothetical protein